MNCITGTIIIATDMRFLKRDKNGKFTKGEMQIIEAGTKAVTKIGEISGLITAVTIRGNYVRYEFSYFNNGEYKSEWLDETEFTLLEDLKKEIGFKGENS